MGCGIAGALGIVACIVGAVFHLEQALYSYLMAYVFVWSMAVGVLIMLMIAHATRARWFIPFRPLAEGMSATLPILIILFVPIAVGASVIYPWLHTDKLTDPHLIEVIHKKRAYLNFVFWVLRAALYFAIWWGLALAMRRHTRRDPAAGRDALATLGGFGLPWVGLALTFASFDWIMSLDPSWYSTIFGVYVFAGGFLAGLSLIAIVAWVTDGAGLLGDVVHGSHYHALGRMMLAFLIFWGYIGFFQGLLIYIANEPHEVTYYVHRLSGAWPAVGLILIFGHFVVPFLLLLSRPLKFRRHLLGAVAVWLVIMHFVDSYWLVLPELHHDTLAPSWMDLAALIGVLGITVAFAGWRLSKRSLVATNDPALGYAATYQSL